MKMTLIAPGGLPLLHSFCMQVPECTENHLTEMYFVISFETCMSCI